MNLSCLGVLGVLGVRTLVAERRQKLTWLQRVSKFKDSSETVLPSVNRAATKTDWMDEA